MRSCDVLADGVAVGDADAGVHEVPADELLLPVVAAVPRHPVVAHLERRGVGVVELADGERLRFGDALAEVGGQIPAAPPPAEQFGRRVVVGVVVGAGDQDAVAGAPQDDGVAAEHRVLLGRLRQRLRERRVGLERGRADDDERGVGRGGHGGVDHRRRRAAHQADVLREVGRGLFLPLPGRRIDHHHRPRLPLIDHLEHVLGGRVPAEEGEEEREEADGVKAHVGFLGRREKCQCPARLPRGQGSVRETCPKLSGTTAVEPSLAKPPLTPNNPCLPDYQAQFVQ